MGQTEIESRIVVLEKEITSLKDRFRKIENSEPWWKQRVGLFAADRLHEEAMRLGSEFRKNEGANGDSGK